MLGSLLENIANINSYSPQEMSQISHCFVEWERRAETRSSSRNHNLLIPGVMLRADGHQPVGTVWCSCSGVQSEAEAVPDWGWGGYAFSYRD